MCLSCYVSLSAVSVQLCVCICSVVTVEEDDEDAGVGELLSTQQVDVLHTEVKGQLHNGAVLHVCGDVGHQG